MNIPAWLRVWKFLENNNPDSMSEIQKRSDVSFAHVRPSLGILNDIGLINITMDGNRLKAVKTRKYFDTHELFEEIHEAIQKSR